MNLPTLGLPAAVLILIATSGVSRGDAPDPLDAKIEQAAKEAQSDNDADHERGMKVLDATVQQLESTTPEKDAAAEARRQFLLGKIEFYLDQQDDAGKYLNKAIELAPANPEYHFFRAQASAMNGDPAYAEAEFINATRLAPKEARYWYGLGLCEAGGGKNDEAIIDFRKAVEADPKHAKATLMIGAMLTQQGKSDEALALFKKAAEIDPGYVLAHANIGQTYQNQEKYADSLQAYRDVLKLDPNDPRAMAKAIQCEQALGLAKERDIDRAAMARLHTDGKFQDAFYCRDQFAVGKTKLVVFEYFDFDGENPIRYSFDVLDDSGEKLQYKITLASPETDNKIAREHGDIGKGERVYFLGGDYPSGEHKTFSSAKKIEPTYDEIKKQVIGVIEGKIEPDKGTGNLPR